MIRCPDPGALRAALDGERADAAAHAAACADCRARSVRLADEARFVATMFKGSPRTGPDVERALARVRARHTTPASAAERAIPQPSGRLLRSAAAIVLVALLGGVLATPGGRVAAASLLERFRAERIAVVPVDFTTVDPAALEALVDVADVEDVERVVRPQQVTDLAAAAELAGFRATPLDRAALPDAVDGPVRVFAHRPGTVRISFADSPHAPAEIRDAVLVLDLPGAVVQSVVTEGGTIVVRGEAGSLQVTVEGGPSLGDVRDALLSLPGLPPETVEALRGIEDWRTTLPLPVPVRHITWEETTVGGHEAVAFGDESGLGSALLWHDGSRFVGVGGTLPLSQVRAVAEGTG